MPRLRSSARRLRRPESALGDPDDLIATVLREAIFLDLPGGVFLAGYAGFLGLAVLGLFVAPVRWRRAR